MHNFQKADNTKTKTLIKKQLETTFKIFES